MMENAYLFANEQVIDGACREDLQQNIFRELQESELRRRRGLTCNINLNFGLFSCRSARACANRATATDRTLHPASVSRLNFRRVTLVHRETSGRVLSAAMRRGIQIQAVGVTDLLI